MLFMFFEARIVALKVKILIKEKAGSSSRFERSDPFRSLYNKKNRYNHTDKGKAVQPSQPILMKPNTTRLDKTSREQVEMNKLNNPYVILMIAKCFKCRESGYRSSDCRR